MQYLYIIIVGSLLFEAQTISSQCFINRYRTKLRGNYRDVIKQEKGSLLISRKVNNFGSPSQNGVFNRDAIYYVNGATGFTTCNLGQSVIIELNQVYELNTFIFWLWDRSARTYGFVVYASDQNIETVILDSAAKQGVVKINFPDQMVKYFRIFNRNGNTSNTQLHIIKAMAFFKQ